MNDNNFSPKGNSKESGFGGYGYPCPVFVDSFPKPSEKRNTPTSSPFPPMDILAVKLEIVLKKKVENVSSPPEPWLLKLIVSNNGRIFQLVEQEIVVELVSAPEIVTNWQTIPDRAKGYPHTGSGRAASTPFQSLNRFHEATAGEEEHLSGCLTYGQVRTRNSLKLFRMPLSKENALPNT
jgi:hypothetical protein